jgi:hypothetical protein
MLVYARATMRRLLWGLVALASLSAPAVAEAADLVVPLGTSVSLSGDHTYGRVLVDGTVNLTGATVIRAAQVNVGPYGAIRPSCTPCTGVAAPNVSIISGGPVVIVPGLGFAGLTGGAVTVIGKSLALGSVITTGSGGPSGPVALRATGGDIRTSLVLAGGTTVGMNAAGDVVTGDVTGRVVGIVSGAGDVLARGTLSTASAAGGSITVRGRDLRIGSVGASAGSGPGGTVRLTASRDVALAGAVTAAGAGASNGGVVAIAAGRNIAGGTILATGAPVASGGAIAVSAKGMIELGQLKADAGVGSPGAGGNGGSVRVTTSGPLVLDDSASADGGKGAGGAGGGRGGVVVLSGLTVAGGDVSAIGGTPTALASVAGGAGGSVSVVGALGVSVGGVFAQAQHGGGGPAAYNGANGGNILLSAPGGNLYARVAYAQGGDGGSAAPSRGGAGGHVAVVGHGVGGLYLVDARGGAGAAVGGVGGAGGVFRGYSDVTLFDSSRRVNIGSGAGDVKGALGIAHSNLPPAAPELALGHRLQITSRSPDATAFRVLRQLAGQARPIVVGTATHPTLVTVPRTRPCVRATYTVQALASPVGWISSPSAALVETIVPSGQDCREVPLVRPFRSSISLGVRALRQHKGVVRISLRIRGVGTVGAILRSRGRRIARVAPVATTGSTLRFRFTIPARYRRTGTLTLQLVAHAPVGTRTLSTPVRIRIVA